MKVARCPLCEATQAELLFTEKKYDLLMCKQCELFFIDPYPDENVTHARVPEYAYDDHKIADASVHYRQSEHFYDNLFPSIKEECKGAKSILDVGCGTGRLLELLSTDDDVYRIGIEFNTARAELARKKARCEVLQTPIETFESDRKFDIIFLINVLSHISSFDRLFGSIRSLLADDGKLILKVGEMTSQVRKSAAFDWEIPDHLHFLGMTTIEQICKKYKFKVVRHDRKLLSSELFSKHRWKAPGRSSARNFVKSIAVHTPFALPILRFAYNKKHGETIYSSFIVLTPAEDSGT